MGNFKLFALNLLTDKMEVDGHMLHAAMKNRIGTNISGANIVTENFWNTNQRKLNLFKKIGEPVSFGNSSSNCSIFYLCRRTRN